ncbi:MAG: HAMP domain-containing histidine kinase [Lachnospiraceae bacterium]|nr:HAMP domain-containing histidine kinase [Lachnospiraceae bacterium]
MVKTLQKKFIVASMTAITILIIVLLGTVNIVNVIRLNNHNNNLMEMLSGGERRFTEDDIGDKPEDFKPDDNVMDRESMSEKEPYEFKEDLDSDRSKFRLFDPVLNEDDRISAVYFVVRVDETDSVIFTDTSHVSTIDEEKAQNYALSVLEKDSQKGKIDNYKYVIKENSDKKEKTIVFLDVNSETQSILAVAVVSAGIGILCWISMLLLIVALSKKAIRPIASNIEKQKQFITDAGHEIKTPLAIILANTDAMELHNGESKWSKNIKKQTTRLSELMQRMLSLAKMDEGTAKLKFEELNLSKILNDAVGSFKETANKKDIAFDKEVDDDIYAKADKESITQLVNILIDNAVKYADEKSTIDIRLKKQEKHIKLIIANACSNLPDIPPEKMFDRFYRGDSARTQKGGGFGIGLSVALAVAEAHNGHISAKYKEDNRISFEVSLPV